MLDLNVDVAQPIKLYCDSISAIHIFKNLVLHERTKHIETGCHFIRKKVLLKLIRLEYLNTKEQSIDLFTKALHPTQFKYLLNINNVYVQLEGEYQSNETKERRNNIVKVVS